MKSGFLPKDRAPDDIIVGSDRDPTRRASATELEADPADPAVEAEGGDEPAMAAGKTA
jgi:hypothetical protein